MTDTRGRGLLHVQIDIDPAHLEEFNRWYNEEHFPAIMSFWGVQEGRRFVATDNPHRFLAYYDLKIAGRAEPSGLREGAELALDRAHQQAFHRPAAHGLHRHHAAARQEVDSARGRQRCRPPLSLRTARMSAPDDGREPPAGAAGLAGAAAGRDHRAGAADRRSASSSLGPAREPLSARRAPGRRQFRPQHPRHRLRAGACDVPRRRRSRPARRRRDRVRQRRRGHERQRRLRPDARLRRHRRPRRPDARRPACSEVLEAHMAAGGGRFRGIRHTGRLASRSGARAAPATRRRSGLLAIATSATASRGWRRSGLSFDAWLLPPAARATSTDLARAFPDTTDRAQPCRRRRSASAPMRASATRSSPTGARRSASSPRARTSS